MSNDLSHITKNSNLGRNVNHNPSQTFQEANKKEEIIASSAKSLIP